MAAEAKEQMAAAQQWPVLERAHCTVLACQPDARDHAVCSPLCSSLYRIYLISLLRSRQTSRHSTVAQVHSYYYLYSNTRRAKSEKAQAFIYPSASMPPLAC